MCTQGRDLTTVLTNLSNCIRSFCVTTLVAHNIASDVALLVQEGMRCDLPPSKLLPVQHLICTQLATVAVCGLPLSGSPIGYKWPKLKESFTAVTNATQKNIHGHDAREDVAMCRLILESLLMGGTFLPISNSDTAKGR